jgi:hypothetical protein
MVSEDYARFLEEFRPRVKLWSRYTRKRTRYAHFKSFEF